MLQDSGIQVGGSPEGQTGTAESVLTEDGVDVSVSDNIVLQKLIRGPRYFDPGKTMLEASLNCGKEGHVAANCPMEKWKKPCFVCGLFGHNEKQCTQGQHCFICKKGGHKAKDCPGKHKRNTQQSTMLCSRCGETGHDMFGGANGYTLDDVKEMKCYMCKQNGHLCCADFSDNYPKEVTCYNCAQAGHIGLGCAKQRRECSAIPAPTLCFNCGEEGHIAKGCTKNAKSDRLKGEPSAHSRKKDKGENDFGAVITSKKTTLLVHGAGVTLISLFITRPWDPGVFHSVYHLVHSETRIDQVISTKNKGTFQKLVMPWLLCCCPQASFEKLQFWALSSMPGNWISKTYCATGCSRQSWIPLVRKSRELLEPSLQTISATTLKQLLALCLWRLPATPDPVAEPQPQVRTSTWKWRGYNIRYQYAGTSGPALVLIHGFGVNSDHWQKNIPVLAMANRVYAIDLIGYGYFDKPNPRELGESFYSFETWGEQLNTFCAEVVKSEAFFMCNSIRGLVGPQAAVIEPQKYKGIVLLDISLRMLHIKKQLWFGKPFIRSFQNLLRNTVVGKLFFNAVATPESVEDILCQERILG